MRLEIRPGWPCKLSAICSHSSSTRHGHVRPRRGVAANERVCACQFACSSDVLNLHKRTTRPSVRGSSRVNLVEFRKSRSFSTFSDDVVPVGSEVAPGARGEGFNSNPTGPRLTVVTFRRTLGIRTAFVFGRLRFTMANPYYGSGPLRSREGLTARSSVGSDEIQLRIDPMHEDLDEQIAGIHSKIRQLKGVAQEIESEAKFQNDFISQLQMTLIKVQAGVKNSIRRMDKKIFRQGSNHVLHVILFVFFCFLVVYLLSKFSRR
ncbi:hypothetical protein IEQ34_017996 [Dendrobium chrysotoxum]|uniref:t-SNARE coiled-coil homology domain-containing protein n=2 Tax=Magnoliopsida TaxID=3398 RepID=A0AAV7GC48_DENCH|nr:hypothetical protein IEQ34_017996 [Dendrobium chrysotoxum]